jgi:hypothetical protein
MLQKNQNLFRSESAANLGFKLIDTELEIQIPSTLGLTPVFVSQSFIRSYLLSGVRLSYNSQSSFWDQYDMMVAMIVKMSAR